MFVILHPHSKGNTSQNYLIVNIRDLMRLIEHPNSTYAALGFKYYKDAIDKCDFMNNFINQF
jgi:hypothetical protein